MSIRRTGAVGRSAAVGILLLSLTACVTTPADQGGIIDSDRSLQRVALAGGGFAFGWVAPTLSNRGYSAALVEPVVFLPSDQEAELIHPSDLSVLGSELNARLLRAVLPRVPMRDTPASDALRFKISIAGLRTPLDQQDYMGQTRGVPLFPELAAGESPERSVVTLLELEASDSVTGAVLARTLRRGPVIALSNWQRQVPMSVLYPLVDTWVAQWAASITQLVRDRDADAHSLLAGNR